MGIEQFPVLSQSADEDNVSRLDEAREVIREWARNGAAPQLTFIGRFLFLADMPVAMGNTEAEAWEAFENVLLDGIEGNDLDDLADTMTEVGNIDDEPVWEWEIGN